MNILVCNDDGVHAPGIRALAMRMAELGDVYVVAPDEQKSASSHGISLHRPLYITEHSRWAHNIHVWSVSGTPVDCVKWAMVKLHSSVLFDLMVSGINEGPNLATDVLYSGTVAAAGEAALQGIPAVAFSLVGPSYPYADAAKVSLDIAARVYDIGLPSDTFISVNLPDENLSRAQWKLTQLGARGYQDEFIEQTDDQGRVYVRYSGEALEELKADNTDVQAIRDGHVSITPLLYRFTNFELIDSLRVAGVSND